MGNAAPIPLYMARIDGLNSNTYIFNMNMAIDLQLKPFESVISIEIVTIDELEI